MKESDAYILGTEYAELNRLGTQHYIWAEEARNVWKLCGIKPGQHVLDLGSGPGFCTFELAHLVGQNGKVIAFDKSQAYLDFIEKKNQLHRLNIECIQDDIQSLHLEANSLDLIWGRWILAWVDNVDSHIQKLVGFLKPGGHIAFHEYYDWSTFQTFPHQYEIEKIKHGILKSFSLSPGEINIGQQLPGMLVKNNVRLIDVSSHTKLSTLDGHTGQWVSTFLHLYVPKVVEMGLLDHEIAKAGLALFDDLINLPGSSVLGPLVVQVVGQKPI